MHEEAGSSQIFYGPLSFSYSAPLSPKVVKCF